MSSDETTCHFLSKIPAKKIVGPVIAERYTAQDHVHNPTAQQIKKTPSPSSTSGKESPVVNGAMSRNNDQVGGETSKARLADAYIGREQIIEDNLRRSAVMPDQIKPRPIWTARSMKRQGRPLPPKDPHGTGS
jgi:hypothetical protein